MKKTVKQKARETAKQVVGEVVQAAAKSPAKPPANITLDVGAVTHVLKRVKTDGRETARYVCNVSPAGEPRRVLEVCYFANDDEAWRAWFPDMGLIRGKTLRQLGKRIHAQCLYSVRRLRRAALYELKTVQKRLASYRQQHATLTRISGIHGSVIVDIEPDQHVYTELP